MLNRRRVEPPCRQRTPGCAFLASHIASSLESRVSLASRRKDQRTYLCTIAKGENPTTGVETRMSLMCKD